MPLKHEPPYPVIDPEPSFERCVANFSFEDIGQWAAVTAVGVPFGYLAGRPLRKETMILTTGLACLAGFMGGVARSHGRLTGYSK
mmetsp:Transcript_20373/g.33600  ORF Transcript_20373/g.33600 Transcript_20373/m.33600 type:complete len:85 (-) Transcript_20373:71-325(-)|eukprot:CAMPEP_0203749688 /NCGR_PEP_ID=MMETSP0098-20131031/4153_1 /ASSEMBLY_ACC=CAM_ASM_000208 /TAXON_ID=96639 /ORGANISM=" , Strain NY0313808BC1" /LENGTH=84 /DNA_ID=CAMNT_0050638781 /DNA_START=169 /DNA_END=423 /DNA_ORIENTATION=-